MSINVNLTSVLAVRSKVMANIVVNCGAGSPTISRSDIPGGVTVTAPAAGTLRVVLPSGLGIPDNVEIFPSLQLTAAGDSKVNAGPYTASTRTFDVYTDTAGVATNLGAGVLVRIGLEFPEIKSER